MATLIVLALNGPERRDTSGNIILDVREGRAMNLLYSEPGCGGSGLIECFCAGDFCAYSIQGTGSCEGCVDCIDASPDEFEMYAHLITDGATL